MSCIITCFNHEAFVEEAVVSVLKQSYPNLELIIVDDGSTDRSKEIIRGYATDKRVQAIFGRHSGLPAICRNIGIKVARGEYIAFLDADDYWYPDKLELQLRHFCGDVVGVGSSAMLIGDLALRRQKNYDKDLILSFHDIYGFKNVSLSSLIVRNSGQLFDEDESLKYVEDFDFQLSITCHTKARIKLLAAPLIYYRVHPYSGSADPVRSAHVLKVIRKYETVVPPSILNQTNLKHYLNYGIKSLRLGAAEARDYFLKAYQYASGKDRFLCALLMILERLPNLIIHSVMFFYYNIYRR